MERERVSDLFLELFTAFPTVSINKYGQKVMELNSNAKSVYIDYDDILTLDDELSEEILNYPEDVLEIANEVLIDSEIRDFNFKPRVRVTNLHTTENVSVRDLRSHHLYKLIQVEGLVRRTSEVKPEITIAIFECERCGERTRIIQTNTQNFAKPTVCQNEQCARTGPFKLLEKISTFEDWQNIRVQESPERLRGGELPRYVDVVLREEIVEIGQTGNKAKIVGILKAFQDSGFKGKKTTYTKYLEAISVEIKERTYEEMELSAEDRERIEEMQNDPEIYEKICKSIAPTIYGHETIKEAIALQQFSNPQRILPDGTKMRGDIHMLLVGDPGMAKSQMLKYAEHISPRGVYTSGKGSSAAGLTAAVIKDEMAGGFALDAGALVIADNGIAAVDEIEKMSEDDRSAMHEVMEQQSCSISKAGIMATLNTRCSILAAANPKRGRFDAHSTLPGQIELTPTILSRFDLIFFMMDVPNKEQDKRIADHITEVYGDNVEKLTPIISIEDLKKYVVYQKTNIPRVMLSKEAKESLENYYVTLREKGIDSGTIPVTARQLQSMIRLACAKARIRNSSTASEQDVTDILKIYESAYGEAATDHETGAPDIDMIMTGKPKSQRDRVITILEIIQKMDNKNDGQGVLRDDAKKEALVEGISEYTFNTIIEELKQKGDLYEPRPDRLKLTLPIL